MSDEAITAVQGGELFGLEGLGWDAGWADLQHDAEVGAGTDPRAGRIARTHRVGFDVFTRAGRLFAVTLESPTKSGRLDSLASCSCGLRKSTLCHLS